MDTPTETLTDAGPAPGKKTNWLSRLWPLGLLVIGLAAIYFSGAYKYLSIDTLQSQRETLKAFVSDYLLFAVVGFILIYALATIFMLPGALWITIAGGFLFGLVGGSLATVTGATLGATTLFFIARTSVGEPLRKRAGPFLRKVEAGFKDGAISYMFFMRFFPGVPFPVANVAPALLGAKARDFIFTTFFGIMPGVIAYTWMGAGLGGVFDRGEQLDIAGLFRQIAPPLVALAVVSLIPVVVKKFSRKPQAVTPEVTPDA